MEKRKSRRRLLSLLLALFMVLTMGTSSFAASSEEENAAVAACKESVFRIITGVKIENTDDVLELMTGTAFLINDTHLVTCDHVLTFNDEIYDIMKTTIGYDREKVDQQKVIQICVGRDVKRDVMLICKNSEIDLAVVRMDEPLGNTPYLKFSVIPPEISAPCYALDFPALIDPTDNTDTNTSPSDDVKISSGLVGKLFKSDNVDYIGHSAVGKSGGPLVNNAGHVIGITRQDISVGESNEENFNIAIDVKELLRILDALMIEYTRADDMTDNNSPDSEPESKQDTETSEYSLIKDLSIFKH